MHGIDLFDVNHPSLLEAYDHDWYCPWQPARHVVEGEPYQKALRNNYAQFIESPLDVLAINEGCYFDWSRDHDGARIAWHRGKWQRLNGEAIPEDRVQYMGGGDRAVRFIESTIVHTKAPLVDTPFRCLPFHSKLLHCVFGWKRENHLRRFTKVICEIAKKNSKSAFASAVALYMLAGDGEPKSKVYGAASDRLQGRIVFDEARDYVNNSPRLHEQIEVVDSKSQLKHPMSGGQYLVLSSDAFRSEGIDSSATIFDELHTQPNRKLFSVLKRAGQARRQPLMVVITTFGAGLNNIWGEEHRKAKRILEGTSRDWETFVMIASAEPIPVIVREAAAPGTTQLLVNRLQQPIAEGEKISLQSVAGEEGEAEESEGVIVKTTSYAKRYQSHLEIEPLSEELEELSQGQANKNWQNDHAIRCANPAVGIIFPIDRIRKEREDAKVSPAAEAEFKQLNLNIVTGGAKVWLNSALWEACGKRLFNEANLANKWCMGGLDISMTNDLTAFWAAFPSWDIDEAYTSQSRESRPHVKLFGMVWVPEEGIDRREEVEEFSYRAYAEQEYMFGLPAVRVCKGPAIDYEEVGRDIVAFSREVELQAVAYDPKFSRFLVEPFLQPGDVECIEHRQGAWLGPGTKRYAELVVKRRLWHGGHPALDRAASAAVLHAPDRSGNQYPSKDKSTSRIDPIIASLMAASFCCDPPEGIVGGGAYSGAYGSSMWEEG